MMATLAPAAWPTRRIKLPGGALPALAMLVAAFLIRLPHFGNPAYQIDEEFYLLVGDRMLHGALPYVDIWDRKPLGLFLLYAAIRLLGGAGIYQYQIVAALFAAATAWTIYRIARPSAGEIGGIAAGSLYLLWIETVEGGGGQAPVFYNLFVAGAAALTFRALDAPHPARPAIAAMALAGLAIQVKYTAVFECFWFGLQLAWRIARQPRPLPRAMLQIAGLAAIALAPTIAAAVFYAAIGHFDAFWFANFQSIFRRAPADPAAAAHRLGQIGLHLIALATCAVASLWHVGRTGDALAKRRALLVAGWLVAALAGFACVGAFYFHYTLPLYVPFAIAAAPIARRRPLGPVLLGIALWLPLSANHYPDFATTRYFRERTAALRALIPADVAQGCMQMLAGPPILYLQTNACTVSPYIFPDHLVSTIETAAIGVDPHGELRRILARRPRVLVSDDRTEHLDPVALAILRKVRGEAYFRAGRVTMEGRAIDVWVSRSLSVTIR